MSKVGDDLVEHARFYSRRNRARQVAVRMRKEDAPMISGLITTRDVFRHAATIVREFGPAAYLRCCLVILRRRKTTFLECVLRPSATSA